MGSDLLSQAEDRCDDAGHTWSTADDPDCCPDCLREALRAAYRAGAEEMRERCAVLCSKLYAESPYPYDYEDGWMDAMAIAESSIRAVQATLEVTP